jgi:hypothetical protein
MADSVRRLTETDWTVLANRIKDGKCTPFIGAGVYSEGTSMRSTIARNWAQSYGYPLSDGSDLARVARALSVEVDPSFARSELAKEVKKFTVPNFTDVSEPYNILADLQLPIYITTNYDDFMEQALLKRRRDAKSETCRWKKELEGETSYLDGGFEPTVANPLVFHMFGYSGNPDSLVLTEDDFFQFLIKVSKEQDLIPHRIRRAITGVSVLLLGYRLDDWDFRVLIHLLASSIGLNAGSTHVSVQMSPAGYEAPEELRAKVQNFFDKCFDTITPNIRIRISWETTQDFIRKLKEKVES